MTIRSALCGAGQDETVVTGREPDGRVPDVVD